MGSAQKDSWKSTISHFLFDVRGEPGLIPLQSRVMVWVFYTIVLVSVVIAPLRIASDLQEGILISAIGLIVFSILVLAGLVTLWITRSISQTSLLFSFAIGVICLALVLDGGGSLGLGYLYIVAGYPVLFFILGLRGGLILPLLFFAGMVIRLYFGDFNPGSIYFDPILGNRFMQALGVATVLGVAAVLYQAILVKNLSYLAYTDGVTRLGNRAKLETTLQEFCNPTLGQNRNFSLISVRLLHFDDFNTNHGTSRGDQILKEFAKRLQGLVPPGGHCFRYSGTGFGLIAPFNDFDHLLALSQEVQGCFSQVLVIDGKDIRVPTSLGATRFPQDGTAPEKLMSNLLSIHGRNAGLPGSISFFDEALYQKERRRWSMGEQLRHSIERNELNLVYHPKVVLKTRNPAGAEVLLRWNNPEFGEVSPSIFIPLAEEIGFIRDLTNWVIHQAVQELTVIEDDFEDLGLIHAINVSPLDLRNNVIIEHLMECLDHAQLSPFKIEIEITEGVLMESGTEVQSVLEEFRKRGFRIAIDDFGTGYSSLSYLHQMRINNLKIDQSFIREITNSPHARTEIVEAIIRMAQSLRLDVTAEGVEEPFQAEILNELGCTYGQGWLFSKPLSIEQYKFWLKTKKQ